jgi:hypothetical protein
LVREVYVSHLPNPPTTGVEGRVRVLPKPPFGVALFVSGGYPGKMPSHGTVKQVRQTGQAWTIVVARRAEPDYVLYYDHDTFRRMVVALTGHTLEEYLIYGEDAVRKAIEGTRLITSGVPTRPTN